MRDYKTQWRGNEKPECGSGDLKLGGRLRHRIPVALLGKKKNAEPHNDLCVCVFPGGTETWYLNLQAIKSVVFALALTWRLIDERGEAIATSGVMFDLFGFSF